MISHIGSYPGGTPIEARQGDPVGLRVLPDEYQTA